MRELSIAELKDDPATARSEKRVKRRHRPGYLTRSALPR